MHFCFLGYASDNKLDENANEQTDYEGELNTTTEVPIALPVQATTEETINETTDSSGEIYRENQQAIDDLFQTVNKFDQIEETTTEQPKPKTRRRGAWKLIRHKPIDNIEVAESQNYHSVLNLFDEIKKDSPGSKVSEKVPVPVGYESYNNYNPMLEQNSDSFEYESHKLSSKAPEETSQTTEINSETREDKQQTSSTSYSEDATEKLYNLPTSSTESSKGSIFDTFYDMFGMSFNNQEESKQTSRKHEEVPVTNKQIVDEISVTTSSPPPTFPEEITDQPSTTARNQTESILEVTTEEEEEVEGEDEKEEATTLAPEVPKITFPVEPWEMKKVRTSTSTEISHETEICYKGRCIKSASNKKKA